MNSTLIRRIHAQHHTDQAGKASHFREIARQFRLAGDVVHAAESMTLANMHQRQAFFELKSLQGW